MHRLVMWACLLSLGQAQTALTRYYSSELSAIPGLVSLRTGGLSTLEFWSVIDEVYLGDSTLVTTELKDHKLILGTTLSRGETDLVVSVGGQDNLFTIVIQSDLEGPQRYVIDKERPRPSISSPLNPRTPSEDLEADLNLTLLEPSPVNDGSSTIFFTFTNHSSQVVALDSARLVITQNDTTLTASVTKYPLRQLVEPGEIHSGFVVAQGAVPGLGDLRWTAIEMQGNGREVTFNASFIIPSR